MAKAQKRARPKTPRDTQLMSPEERERHEAAERTRDALTLAQERFRLIAEAESGLRSEMLDDKRFRASDQWDPAIKSQRIADRKPCLTINKLNGLIKQITNGLRSSRPSIQINAVDDAVDPETADTFQGIIRHIENNSQATVAYDTAVENAVENGRGFFRLITEYVPVDRAAIASKKLDARVFDQDIKIKRIRNPFTVYFDPACQEPDYSDARFCFLVEDLPEEEYRRKYPKSAVATLSDFSSIGDQAPLWYQNGCVRVAEYYSIDYETVTLVQLSDGMVCDLKTAKRRIAAAARQGVTLEIEDERDVELRTIRHQKINAIEILEDSEWPGQWIPVIPVLGDEIDLDGRVDYRGIVRDSKDQQRVYNFQVTALVETVGQASKSPWIVAAGQIELYKAYWDSAHLKSWAYLPYDPKSLDGELVPAPRREAYEPAIQALVVAVQQADNDLKATAGAFDAYPRERESDLRSGKAIMARQRQQEAGNSHFSDNFARALTCCGRQLLDLIPKILDVSRVMRIRGTDDQWKKVMVFSGQANDPRNDPNFQIPPGVKGIYDMGAGRFDLTVSVGPDAGSRRQEAVELLTEALRASPNLLEFVGDLYFGMMDHPIMRQISARLKKMLPKDLQDDLEGKKPEIPREFQMQMQQLAERYDQLVEALNEATETIKTKKLELASRENIAAMQAQVELIKLEMQANAQAGHALLQAELAQLTKMQDFNQQRILEGEGAERQAQQTLLEAQAQQAAEPPMDPAAAEGAPPV